MRQLPCGCAGERRRSNLLPGLIPLRGVNTFPEVVCQRSQVTAERFVARLENPFAAEGEAAVPDLVDLDAEALLAGLRALPPECGVFDQEAG